MESAWGQEWINSKTYILVVGRKTQSPAALAQSNYKLPALIDPAQLKGTAPARTVGPGGVSLHHQTHNESTKQGWPVNAIPIFTSLEHSTFNNHNSANSHINAVPTPAEQSKIAILPSEEVLTYLLLAVSGVVWWEVAVKPWSGGNFLSSAWLYRKIRVKALKLGLVFGSGIFQGKWRRIMQMATDHTSVFRESYSCLLRTSGERYGSLPMMLVGVWALLPG